ncbi:hypothetical protein HanPI659440_Chr14g0566291 [Helianthus annuus]|nr:hypothetical protein HanPI659440_Chr14g0566291 [Helianthus annuus]
MVYIYLIRISFSHVILVGGFKPHYREVCLVVKMSMKMRLLSSEISWCFDTLICLHAFIFYALDLLHAFDFFFFFFCFGFT